MLEWIRHLDRILRGDATRLTALRHGTIELPIAGTSLGIAGLGMIYGLCMGFYAMFRSGGPNFAQVIASMLKVPLLFFLTLLVTFPSLYVFNALVGSRLTASSVLRLLIAAMAVMAMILASFGPIVAFFSVSTTGYSFMLLLNVAVFTTAGLLGSRFLLQTLQRLSLAPTERYQDLLEDADESGEDNEEDLEIQLPRGPLEPVANEPLARNVLAVFRVWVLVFGLVGAQMGWVLRPFIGTPNRPFTILRVRESNFFEAIVRAAQNTVR